MALPKALHKWLSDQRDVASLCHVDKDTLTESERRFVERCHNRLRAVHRPSWPDFLVFDDDRLYAVEVKTPADGLSANQRRTFDLLTDNQILDIYVWVSDRPNRLIPWHKAKNRIKSR